jgi:DNA (cytosine-5)-methyltransferase 1
VRSDQKAERLPASLKRDSARPTPTIRVLSVFTGAGGLDVGLEAAGFEIVACIERHELARRTLQTNRDWPLLDPPDISDVAKYLRPQDLNLRRGDLELLAAGPPCQPFSKAAQWSSNGRAGMVDPRSRCLRDLLTLVDRFLPKAILIENVVGFIRKQGGALNLIRSTLDAINRREGTSYQLTADSLNAVDYGVPQRRERAFLVALRDGCSFDWPSPTHTITSIRAWDAIGDLDEPEKPVATGKWAQLLPSIPEGWNYLWHTDRGGGRPLFGYRSRYW